MKEEKSLASSLRFLAVSIVGDSKVSVVVDDSAPTAFIETAKKKITISIQVVPEQLRNNPIVVRRLLEGVTAHEVGHLISTTPFTEMYGKFVRGKTHTELAQTVRGIVEDARINYIIQERYGWDIGKRLKHLLRVTKETCLYSMRRQCLDEMSAITLPSVAIGAYCYGALYDGDPDDVFSVAEKEMRITVPEETMERVKTAIAETKDARYAVTERTLKPILHKVYELLLPDTISGADYSSSGRSGRGQKLKVMVPKTMGGEMEMLVESEEQASELSGMITEQEKESNGKGDNKNGNDSDTADTSQMLGASAGAGSGLLIEAPNPNFDRYNELVQKNNPIIRKMLEKFKLDETPVLRRQRLQRQGRLMNEIIGHVVASSHARPQELIHERKTIEWETKSVKLSLIIDMSESMDESVARDVLTVIAEVAGRKLSDEDFSVIVFGSGFQKIKAHIEGWHNTKARIGGVESLGGTVLAPALEASYAMLKQFDDSSQRVVIIASDFEVYDPPETKELIEKMTRDGVAVIGVGLCGSDVSMAQEYCGDLSTYVPSMEKLPELFFEVYRKFTGRPGRRR